MLWSDSNDHQRTMVLQTVLVMNIFSSLVLRPRMRTNSCLERPRTNHRLVAAATAEIAEKHDTAEKMHAEMTRMRTQCEDLQTQCTRRVQDLETELARVQATATTRVLTVRFLFTLFRNPYIS